MDVSRRLLGSRRTRVFRAGDIVDLTNKRRFEAFRFVIIWATALASITLQTAAHAAALSDRVRIAENARSVASRTAMRIWNSSTSGGTGF